MQSVRRPPRRQSKSVTFTYGSVAAALLLVVVAVALVVVPPAPPSVAEFAPTVDKQIDKAPEGQSSQFGAGEGACGEGQACEPGAAASSDADGGPTARRETRTIDQKRVRRCVGNPARQIEDPQSPPCVNYWEGDNGGATSQGVTRDEIRVAWPDSSITPAGPALDLFVEFFNRRFEFYGRKLRLVRYTPASAMTREAGQKADAEAIRSLAAFASGPYAYNEAANAFHQALARERILSVTAFGEYLSERQELTPEAPYVWSYLPTLDVIEDNVGEWTCRTLKGHLAQWGGAGTSTKPRKIGLAVGTYTFNQRVSPGSRLRKHLDDCGAPYEFAQFDEYGPADQFRQLLARWQQIDNVTSIMCLCDTPGRVRFVSAADGIQYYPEWLVLPVADQDSDRAKQTPNQNRHEFGLSALNKWNRLADMPWYWAAREVDPTYSEPADGPAGGYAARQRAVQQYAALLVLASGIQMAGPNLTPESFQRGLMSTTFPNPGAGGPPYYQATVGFGPGKHSMVSDFAAIWFDPKAESYERTTVGSFCYVGLGTRWALGRWPDRPMGYFDPLRCR